MEYLVIFEKGEEGYGAYVPDLPGCTSTGKTLEEVKESIKEAISGHIETMRAYGEEIPLPTTTADICRVA
jgi:predicted RNase H-like HicB family nuclease